MEKIELNDFYNAGFGWICKQCERELMEKDSNQSENSRLMREGESESKQPKFSNRAMAKWADAAQRILVCPSCGVTEPADKF